MNRDSLSAGERARSERMKQSAADRERLAQIKKGRKTDATRSAVEMARAQRDATRKKEAAAAAAEAARIQAEADERARITALREKNFQKKLEAVKDRFNSGDAVFLEDGSNDPVEEVSNTNVQDVEEGIDMDRLFPFEDSERFITPQMQVVRDGEVYNMADAKSAKRQGRKFDPFKKGPKWLKKFFRPLSREDKALEEVRQAEIRGEHERAMGVDSHEQDAAE